MAEAVVEAVVVLDQGLYRYGGLVNRWMIQVTRKFYRGTFDSAPVRTGRLRGSIRWDVRREGERIVGGTLSVGAAHGLYVLRGTGGPDGRIYTTKGYASRGGAARVREERWIVTVGGRGGYVRMSSPGKRGARLASVPVRQGGMWLSVPRWKGSEARFWTVSVRGQDANNFVLKGWRKMSRTHSALRGRIPAGVLNP